MADDALVAEVERLRAENEALRLRMAMRRRPGRRSAWALLVLGCMLAALSVPAIWLRVTLLDTDAYVDTVAPIAAHPTVQTAVADRLDGEIDRRIDFGALASQVLPERAGVLAPVIQTGVHSFIRSRLDEFTRSQRFQVLWTEANRRAHARLVELLVGGRTGRLALDEDTVYLDLSPVVDRIRSGLQERGLSPIAAAIPPTVDGRVTLVQSHALVRVQSGIRLLKALAIVLPLLALACLAGAIWLTRPRRRGLLRAGIGVALTMLVLLAALGLARSAYLDALGRGAFPHGAAADIFDTLTAFLRTGLRIALAAAVVLALASFAFGLPFARIWRSLVTDSRRALIAERRTPLLLAVAAVAGCFLVLRDPLTGRAALVIVFVAALAAGAIVLLGLQAGEAVAEDVGADHQRDRGHQHSVVGRHP
jgi:hypothetical protein